ncbi:hypothetical protein BKA70DRAFT_1125905 [Coprinopsis sp. MPI-PUGE-AT-0042]|nr:hypothetical protein BKA70DRAFT_1125905 [Coprinopsis sp. MPI-PUGE-AT-0042]
MASSSTQAEREYYGVVSAKSRYANITLTFLDVGIQMFMCLYGLSVFLETPKLGFQHKQLRKGRARFIILSFTIWILSAIPASIDSWVNFEDLFRSGPSGIDFLKQTSGPPAGHRWIAPLNQILLLLYITLGEILMVWRCFIIWRDRKWVVILPALTCLATIAIALTPTGVNIRWTLRLIASRILLSVLTNVLVTSLILYKLIQTRRAVSQVLGGVKKPKMYGDVIAILIESAAPVAIFGILLAISFFNIALVQWRLIERAHWAVFNDVTSLFYYSFCALSPQMIIFRVTTGRSWTSARDSGSGGSGVFSQPIHFARPEGRLNEYESSGDTQSISNRCDLAEKGKAQDLVS